METIQAPETVETLATSLEVESGFNNLSAEIANCGKELERILQTHYVGHVTGTSINMGLGTLQEIITLLKTHYTGGID